MTVTTFMVDAQVGRLIDEAVKHAQPLWVGWLSGASEVLPRVAAFFEPADRAECYFNAHLIQSGPADDHVLIDRANLSKTKTSAALIDGPLVTPRQLLCGDCLVVAIGNLQVWGPVTKEMWS